MDNVCVLMTTYNPKVFVIDQVKSILNQKGVNIDLIIRDDGSLETMYLDRLDYDNITILRGENLGVANNIMFLLDYAKKNKKEFKYFAYSDQDDVWLEDKILSAIEELKKMNQEIPNLYYSNLKVVNENLNFSHFLFKKGVVNNTFEQSLAQVFCFACTCVFNYKMVEMINSIDIKNMGFDSLIYYTAILFGDTYYDDNSYILYRQHGNNVSGQHLNGINYFVNKIRTIRNENYKNKVFKENAIFLKETFGNCITTYNNNLLDLVINYDSDISSKIKLLINPKIKAGYYPKDLYRMIRILINKY